MHLFLNTAAPWAFATTLLVLATAWFAYAVAEKHSRNQTFEALEGIVAGLEWELAFIRLWAQSEDSPAYLQSKTKLEDPEEDRSWKDPRGLIHRFEDPTVKSLTRSAYSGPLHAITKDFSTLNCAILKFYDVYDEYRRYITTRPQLYDSVSAKSAFGSRGFTQEESQFLSRVFEYNRKLHVEIIGGDDSPEDQRCLHNTFRQASGSLQSFKDNLKREPSPKLFGVLHVVAATFVAAAVVLMVQWARLRFGLVIPGLS